VLNHGPGVVLVVDDNPVNQRATARSINSLGYRARMVPGGAAALEEFGRSPVSLVLMDCQMPGMDGYQTAVEMRLLEASRQTPHVPIIALTANPLEDDQDRCRAAGMDDYLAKPIRLARLSATLSRWMPQAAHPFL